MKRIALFSLISILGIIVSFAGNWQKKYLTDEFGDVDYSKPVFVIDCENSISTSIAIYYRDGVFVLCPIYASTLVQDATSLKAKSANGKVYTLEFSKPHRSSEQHVISDLQSVSTLIDLLEQGNFTLSFQRPADWLDESFNYNFKIGRQGQGILKIYENDFPPMLSHEAQGDPDVYKGTIGKYKITMVLDHIPEYTSDPKIFKMSGKYWYGNDSNGKMTLKGTQNFNQGGVIKFDEYDPSGKKCGSFILHEQLDNSLTGTMTNAAGTTFKVQLDPQ